MEYTYNKFDLFTLALKQKLIGSKIFIDDGTVGGKPEVVEDYFADYKTGEIHIKFVGATTTESFDLGDKYKVAIVDYFPTKRGKKGKRKKDW